MVQANRAQNFAADHGRSSLGDVIRRFAEKTTSIKKHWELNDQNIDKLLLAIFREIDETVLPREIVLSTNTDVKLRLLVASRRLLSLDIEGDAEPPAQADDDASDDVALAYTNRLYGVLKPVNELRIDIAARDMVSSSNRTSCSAHSLAASIGLPLRAAEPSESISEFFLGVEDLALGSVKYRRKSNQTEKHGDDALTDLLVTVAERNYNQTRQMGSSAGIAAVKPFCSVLRINETMSVLIAHDRDEKALFVLPANKVSVATELWQKIFAKAP